MDCQRVIYIFTAMILMLVLLGIQALIRANPCTYDLDHMTRLLSNFVEVNNLDWQQLAGELGHREAVSISDLIQTWIDDHLYGNLPTRKRFVTALLDRDKYIVDYVTVKTFRDFERCTDVVYWVIFGSISSSVVVLILGFFGPILFKCYTNRDYIINRYTKAKKRTRNLSSCTDVETGQAAEVLLSATIQNPVYESSLGFRQFLFGVLTPCHLPTDQQTDRNQELSDSEVPKINTRSNCFGRAYDTTFQRHCIKQILNAMNSVGLLFDKNGARGSVVRVGSKYVITAWHVVKGIVQPTTHSFHNQQRNDNLLADPEVYIDFNEYCRQSPKETHFSIYPKIMFLDEQLDIVVLEISGRAEYLPDPVRQFSDVSNLITARNELTCVHLIGQHPKKETVVADMSCKILNRNDKRVKKAIKWTKKHTNQLKQDLASRNENPNMVSTAYFDVQDTMNRLIFDTYLEFGGSGGAVMAFTPEEDLALVAILTHGLPPFRSCYTSGIPVSITMEVGTAMNAIRNSSQWDPGMEKIKEDIFQEHIAMETDEAVEEMDTESRV